MSMSHSEKAARRLAAIKMGLVNDPEGLKLPDDLWQQMSGKVEALGSLIAAEICRQAGPDMVDNLGDGESIIFTGPCPAVNLTELAEKIWQWIVEEKDVR